MPLSFSRTWMIFNWFSHNNFLCTQDHYTALHIAVKHCKPQVVQILLGYGANVQHKGGKVTSKYLHYSTPLSVLSSTLPPQQNLIVKCMIMIFPL